MAYKWTVTKQFVDDPNVLKVTQDSTPGRTSKYKPREYRVLDDDGEVYFEGLFWGDDSEDMFAPLDDYGQPSLGAVNIQYRGKTGEWETL